MQYKPLDQIKFELERGYGITGETPNDLHNAINDRLKELHFSSQNGINSKEYKELDLYHCAITIASN